MWPNQFGRKMIEQNIPSNEQYKTTDEYPALGTSAAVENNDFLCI